MIDKLSCFFTTTAYMLAFLLGSLIVLVTDSLYAGIFLATGIIFLRALISLFDKNRRNFPVLSGIIEGVCFTIFLLCIVVLIKS